MPEAAFSEEAACFEKVCLEMCSNKVLASSSSLHVCATSPMMSGDKSITGIDIRQTCCSKAMYLSTFSKCRQIWGKDNSGPNPLCALSFLTIDLIAVSKVLKYQLL